MASDFYLRYYVGHKGKFGHEFLEFEFRPDGERTSGRPAAPCAAPAREAGGEPAGRRGGAGRVCERHGGWAGVVGAGEYRRHTLALR